MIYIKVLQIISGNDNGGGGKHVLNLCVYSKGKFDTVIGCIGKGELYDNARSMGIEVILIESLRNNQICDYVKENNVDIINFHGAKAFFMHYIMKKKLIKPCAATVHSDYRYDFLNNKLKYLFFTPLSKLGLKSFPYYICVSKYIKKLLEQSNFTGKKTVVNNGIDLEEINILNDKDKIRNKYDISKEDFVYVMVARMHPIKNHLICIEAFNKLNNEYSNTKLLLIGDGELKSVLEEKCNELSIKDKVIFTGFQSNVVDFINASDISILTSFNEGGSPPIVILESGAAKRAAICSDVGDINECINDETGFLIDPKSVEDIYLKMKSAYENKDMLRDKGQNLYELVKKQYSMNTFCDGYYNFYKQILSE
ncbi:glycoside hydrolase [Clostridium carboxidivorans P7]|uniref:Glycosyl transferase group 1 n=1 Tax=Clostridium carboxidivorans P7 TaxID=536227 RepID=C6PW80_9CLOT|nr:glycosyltransferase family 4 protein [Clostridium carboxidivorans]AKN32506.1 glycoside hydrolase [Clostridium carboxidivorans P7]EET86494.1 glycosyl transferase group 1 [Clostridium carboxidivorans P7]EFG87768.1 glycosyltransferase, group 1 family protein [Clostridium carboxidivorans P7]